MLFQTELQTATKSSEKTPKKAAVDKETIVIKKKSGEDAVQVS